MTSASELFHTRRFRFGRNSDPIDDTTSDLPLSPPNSRHYLHRSRRDRLYPEVVCDTPPPRRSSHHLRQSSHHRLPVQPPQERESSRLEQGGQQSVPGNASRSGSHGSLRSRLRSSGNDTLPGAVLLARERLLQRLRSVTLSSSRRSNRSSSSNHHNSFLIGDDFRLVDAVDWETEWSSQFLASMAPLNDTLIQHVSKRPPGLTQKALNCLPVEVFCIQEEGEEQNSTSRTLRECSICLESFLEGDELIRLPCGHRYHFCCLDPWVRTCGDCPYCRRDINVLL